MSLLGLIEVLRRAGAEPTARELAEAIWLAPHLAPKPYAGSTPTGSEGTTTTEDNSPWLNGHRAAQDASIALGARIAGPAALASGTPVRSPSPPGLPNVAELRRALRPLRRRVASIRRHVIDESATATLIASTGVWLPALVPAPERHFDVLLAVDNSSSMRMWQHLEADLATVLTRSGAFRDVRVGRMSSARQGFVVRTGRAHRPWSPAALIDSARRRLFLIFTDAAAPPWHDGTASRQLLRWARTGPVAILQALPEQMWSRTGLPCVTARATTTGTATPNTKLRIQYRRRRHTAGVPVPVLGLEPAAIRSWARLIAGPVTDLALAIATLRSTPVSSTPVPDAPLAGSAVQRFRASSSPQAYRLAVCLSLVPLALPVMRLVQGIVLPGSSPSLLAEIVLGGLLIRTGDEAYDFVEGAREELLGELRRSEATVVLDAVSAFVADHAGNPGPTFAALALSPAGYVNTAVQPFGWVHQAAARRLGLYEESTYTRNAHTRTTGFRMVLVGPPGAGKGTQAEFIAAHLAVPKVSTGDIFRANITQGTPLGMEAKRHMDENRLVPDEVTINMVRDRLTEPDAIEGFLLDGFPRTVPQAAALDNLLTQLGTSIDIAMELVVDDDEVIRRLSGRRTCPGCGKIWHVEFDPPERPDTCDRCGSELFQRNDDTADVIVNRLVEYADKTAPLVDFYGAQGKLVGIDATGPVEDVAVRVIDALRSYGA